MRNRFILPLVLLAVSAVLVWPEFYSDYGEGDRQSLAEAYYLAGSQYLKVEHRHETGPVTVFLGRRPPGEGGASESDELGDTREEDRA